LIRSDVQAINTVMLRGAALVVLMASLLGCATAPEPPAAWYILSPPLSADYPQGNAGAPITSWVRIDRFQTVDECQDALLKIHNKIQRPVSCVSDDDPRLRYPWLFVPRR
jgi:hypothetical protein